MADEEQRLRDIQREYLDFLDDEVSDDRTVENVERFVQI